MADTETDTNEISSPNTKADKPWLFKAGQPSANPAGRPRKGQTLAERLAREDAKVARRAVKARNKRLELTNMVGETAWKTYLAYNLGLPAQKFTIEQTNSPMAELMRELAGLNALPSTVNPLYIEGTGADSADRAT